MFLKQVRPAVMPSVSPFSKAIVAASLLGKNSNVYLPTRDEVPIGAIVLRPGAEREQMQTIERSRKRARLM